MENRNNQNYGQENRDSQNLDLDTLIDNEKKYSDQEYQEDDSKDKMYEVNDFSRNENIPNEKRIINEDDLITNDEEEDSLEDQIRIDQEDQDVTIEKDGDLDNKNEDDAESEDYFQEKHPRQF